VAKSAAIEAGGYKRLVRENNHGDQKYQIEFLSINKHLTTLLLINFLTFLVFWSIRGSAKFCRSLYTTAYRFIINQFPK